MSEAWRRHYNESRHYTSMGWLTSNECASARYDRPQIEVGMLTFKREEIPQSLECGLQICRIEVADIPAVELK
jgi:hypothetical protein